MKISSALIVGKNLLSKAGISQPLRESKLIICYALSINIENSLLNIEKNINKFQIKRILSLFNRRAQGEPFAYLTKSVLFFGFNFSINNKVLIPRPETEELVEIVLKKILNKHKKYNILDIGTGSGVILASLLMHLPKSYGIGTDISINALKVSKTNLNNLKLNDRSRLINTNWSEGIKDNSFDIIVCNPPYIADHHIKNLHKEVKNYEPLTALKGGKDGLNSLRSLLPSARKVIKNNGLAVFEIGFDQSSKVEKIFNDNNFLIKRIEKDLSGIERMIIAKPN
jgi:release factor glutamine methyltransferase